MEHLVTVYSVSEASLPTPTSFPVVRLLTGQVVSKSNFRRGDQTWRKVRDFEDAVALEARIAMPLDWHYVADSVPVSKRPKIVSVIAARTLLDAGNISKSILDAVQGILYANDAEVASVTEMVTRSRSNQAAVVTFAQLPSTASQEDIVRAVQALLSDPETFTIK